MSKIRDRKYGRKANGEAQCDFFTNITRYFVSNLFQQGHIKSLIYECSIEIDMDLVTRIVVIYCNVHETQVFSDMSVALYPLWMQLPRYRRRKVLRTIFSSMYEGSFFPPKFRLFF